MPAPWIRIHGTSAAFEGNLTTSLLNILLRNGFPIETICGGKAQCGRDLIRIRAGGRFFSPLRDREARRLSALAAQGEPSGPGYKACLPELCLRGRGDRGPPHGRQFPPAPEDPVRALIWPLPVVY